jgi:hypothetical protein
MDAARERRPVKGNIIILWRIADTIVPLLKHLLPRVPVPLILKPLRIHDHGAHRPEDPPVEYLGVV